jgi:hypothetical protein
MAKKIGQRISKQGEEGGRKEGGKEKAVVV